MALEIERCPDVPQLAEPRAGELLLPFEARQGTLSPIGRPDLKLVMLIPGEPQRGAEAPAGTAPSIAPGPRHG